MLPFGASALLNHREDDYEYPPKAEFPLAARWQGRLALVTPTSAPKCSSSGNGAAHLEMAAAAD